MSTALSTYDAGAVSAVLSTANQLYHATAGSPSTTQPVTVFGTQTGYIEIYSQGAASGITGAGSLPAQSGHGWFLDDTTLDGQDLLSGAFSSSVRFCAMQGASQAGTMTADVIVRVSRYHSGTYTTMCTMTLTGQTINATLTNYTPSGTASTTLSFIAGDKYYIDRFVNITAGSGNSTQGIRVNRQSSDTSTHVGDATTIVTTNGYQASSGGVSLSKTIPGVGTLSGTISKKTALSKTIPGVGTLAGSFTLKVALGKTLAGTGTLAGSLSVSPGHLSATISGHGTLAGAFSLKTALSRTISGVGTLSGSLGAPAHLAATIAGRGTLSGPITITGGIPGVQVTINRFPVEILEGSFEIDDSINSVSTCMFIVRDLTGLNHYHKNQQISITDSIRGLYYTGYINSVEEDNQNPNVAIFATVACRDNHAIPERRTYQGPEYTSQYAGVIFADLLNTVKADGITAQYASRRETTVSDFAGGTLTNTTAQSNIAEGDLELSPSGTAVNFTETGSTFASGSLTNTHVFNNTLAQVPFNAVKLTGTNAINNANNTYSYVQIWSGSHSIGANDRFVYDVFITAASPEYKMGVDLVCTDGTTLRDTATDNSIGNNFAFDAQDLGPHPMTDLTGFANGQWYHRDFNINCLSGKTVQYVSVAIEGDKTGIYTAYFRNIYFENSSFVHNQNIFIDTTTALNTSKQLQNYGYSGVKASVAVCYDTVSNRVTPSHSLSGAVINTNTLVSWASTTNAAGGADNGASAQVGYSLDAGVSFIPCTNNSPLPDLPAGYTVSGMAIQFIQYLFSGTTPENTCYLTSFSFQLTPGYNGTKVDVNSNVNTNSTWAAGTFSSTTNNSGSSLSLTGITKNWDDGFSTGQTLTGGPNAEQFVKNKTLLLGVDGIGTTSYDAKSQFTFAPQLQNFTAEIDVLVGGWDAGLHYRTTNYGTGAGTYAFAAMVSPTQVYIARGSNSTSSTNVVPALTTSASVVLTPGNWHRLKIVINGTSHKLFLDDVQMISYTDTNFNASGYIGAIIRNGNATAPTHRQVLFDNFGVMPLTGTLSGTWISPSISLNSLGTYYSSDLFYANNSTDVVNTTITTDYTLNGGSTWINIPTTLDSNNNASGALSITPGTSLTGVSIQYRFTLSTTTPSSMPSLNTVKLKILGGFSASGTRVSSALSLAQVGRLGSSVVACNSILPANTSLGVDTSINGGTSWTDVTASLGGTIPGLTVQGIASADSYTSNTSAQYTSTNATGGAAASTTYDTINSRLSLVGGSKALYVWNTPGSMTDIDLIIDMDRSDSGGCAWHYVDANNFYELIIADNSATTNAGTINLYKTVGGTRTQLLTNASINFVRGTYHRIRVTMKTNLITTILDGVVIANTTDSSLTSGKSGLRNDGGTSRYYQLRVQQLGQLTTGISVLMRLRLSSTDPLVTPQVLDTTLAAFGNTIQRGALIPQTAYKGKYLDVCFNDLMSQSSTAGQFWWYIDKLKIAYFLQNTGVPSPWIASDNPGDFLDAGLKVIDQSDRYCNHVIVQNVLQTTPINESRQGDSLTRSWSFAYDWASAPTILVNGIAQSVGITGVDTGKTFYYTPGSNTITIDASVTTYTNMFTISFSGTGQYLTDAIADNLTEQAAVSADDQTTGIVEYTIDGTGLTYTAGLAVAQAYCAQYSVRGKVIQATTIRDGLQVGQLIPVFLTPYAIADQLFLIRNIKTKLTSGAGAGGQYQNFWYTLELISGPDIGDWTKLYQLQ